MREKDDFFQGDKLIYDFFYIDIPASIPGCEKKDA